MFMWQPSEIPALGKMPVPSIRADMMAGLAFYTTMRRSEMKINGLGSSLRFVAGAAVLLGGVTAAQAGFFERLFGVESEPGPQPRQYYQQPAQAPAPSYREFDSRADYRDPLSVTVRKRAKERTVRREKERQPRREQVETAAAAAPAEPIDPAKNPEWFLQDPTLRRGDILVLKDEVLVFQGGRMPFTRANFASLQESDLPKDERDRLSHMAGLKPVLPARTAVASASQ
jgi:hypothetical protein